MQDLRKKQFPGFKILTHKTILLAAIFELKLIPNKNTMTLAIAYMVHINRKQTV